MIKEIKSQIDELLNDSLTKYAFENDFSGNISIYLSNEDIFNYSSGYRDLQNKLPNQKDTCFGIASGTKLFTAIGILKLIETGELKLSAKVSSLFDKKLNFIDNNATIEQLLCHKSGIFDYYDEDLITDFDNYKVDIPWMELETPSDYLPLFEGRNAKFCAGEKTSYSNGGYIFLGLILEKLTGNTYRDYIYKNVLSPAGMTQSGFFAFNALPSNTAYGYVYSDENIISNIYKLPIRGGSDGGMYTCSKDLNLFWNSLFSYKIINETLVKKLCNPHSCLWNTVEYGLGIYIKKMLDHKAFYITGSDAGVGFSSRYIPQLHLNINILSNKTDGNVKIIKFIMEKMNTLQS